MTSPHPGAEAQARSQVLNQCPNLDLLPSQITSEAKVRDVKISPDGSLVLYQVTEFYGSGNRTLSALWIAETDEEDSAVQLTSGEFNDHGGVFHPDGTQILFLSDREAPGETSHIYTLALGQPPLVDYRGYHRDGTPDDDDEELEPCILTSEFDGVQAFEISLDGDQVAFLSPDESTPEQAKKVQEKNDAKVVDSKDEFPRLRVYDFCSDEVHTLENIREDRYIEAFTWDPTSECLLYRLCRGGEVLLESISVVDENAEPKSQGSYPQPPSGPNIWLTPTRVASLQSFGSGSILDARALVIHGLPIIPMDQEPADPPSGDVVRILRAVSILDPTLSTNPAQNMGPGMAATTLLPPQTPQTLPTECSFPVPYTGTSGDQILCQIKHARRTMQAGCGTDTFVVLATTTSMTPQNTPTEHNRITIFETCDDTIWFNSWDARCIPDAPDFQTVTCTFAAVLGSRSSCGTPNVWTGQIQIPVDGGAKTEPPLSISSGNLTKLSNHPERPAEASAFTLK
ncbi:hypothetical protein P691DRAFT_792003 [Macrolepiota fuliginosa MF-IS2]|uniref:Dipeptidylpeptidase IV N-terminal domain-containing protein n=1 Tax=Macrolepiota fuliginosa MF-IS2 TaxID=1400762 RepID=A0A9P5X0L1_9AGAR|nr:hypothetical protein P691DRAFT_792003 [Macrolepiota fuliginosa MF-IS2]